MPHQILKSISNLLHPHNMHSPTNSSGHFPDNTSPEPHIITSSSLLSSDYTNEKGLVKDDKTVQAEHAYDILFIMFLALLALGCINIWMLYTMKKFRRPIVAFYASSLCVVLFRVVLFMDQWWDYPDNVYVILLVSMPTYLYLITGMS